MCFCLSGWCYLEAVVSVGGQQGAARPSRERVGVSGARGAFPETNPWHFLTRLCQTLYLPRDGKCCSVDGFKLYVTAIGSTLKKVLKENKKKKAFTVNEP